MKVHDPNSGDRAVGIGAVLVLVVLLCILFWRSFLPEYVHFSNDGPLGQQNSAWSHLPEAFFGTWAENNDIGDSGGAWAVSISALFRWAVGPVGYAKFLVPFTLFILGLGAWNFFRQLKLSPLAALLGTLAAVLNSTFFSTACWGVAPQEIAIGMDYFALALVVSIGADTPLLIRLARLAMAGLCVGMNVMEAADIGAIFSLFVSAFVVVHALIHEKGGIPAKIMQGVWQVAVVAVFAGFIASQTVASLVGVQIQGISATSQDTETKAQHWDWATQWSLPKVETLGLVVPGLFGYKMDTPANMDPAIQSDYVGGNYWGAMGRDPSWDRYFASGSKGSEPQGAMIRQTGGENYSGILVVLVAIWAAAQGLRRRSPALTGEQQGYVWFWTAVVVLSVLFAWGRFSFFYAILYKLPYFSTIRSPTKFLIVFSWALAVLFAYGVDVLSRCYLIQAVKSSAGKMESAKTEPAKSWWLNLPRFDQKWIIGCVAALVLCAVAWLVYASKEPVLSHYLQTVQFPNDPSNPMADTIAAFSVHQAGWFLLLFAVAAGLVITVIAGVWTGWRAKVGGGLLVLFLVVDMGRANLPYINYWDYKQKYDIDSAHPGLSTNPILNFLMDKYYDHRVAQLPFQYPPGMELFGQLYTIEWVQHQFPFYNIQTLDLFQRPRVASDIAAYEGAVYFHGTPDTVQQLTREWQLTNTRYLLGPVGYLDVLNTQLDPVQHRFQVLQRFSIGPKPGIINPTQLEEITGIPDTNGVFALFEFTGALPRIKMYSNWRTTTNDDLVLKILPRPDFDPEKTVLVSTPQPGMAEIATNANTGTVDFKSYDPDRIVLNATATSPSVLLYNSKYDPNWKVTVDGQPAPLLRCNYIMRGVYLTPGQHTVVFSFSMSAQLLYVTVAAYATGILLAGFLIVTGRKRKSKSD